MPSHDLSDLRKRCKNIGSNLVPVAESILDSVPLGEVAHWLGATPTNTEIGQALRKVRDCAAGHVEVTAGTLCWAGPPVQTSMMASKRAEIFAVDPCEVMVTCIGACLAL